MNWMLITLLAAVALVSRVSDEPSHDPQVTQGARPAVTDTDPTPHPAVSGDPAWAGIMLLVIGGMFLAAAVIGPVVRANTPEEPPEDHHPHDDHAHDHGHGAHGH